MTNEQILKQAIEKAEDKNKIEFLHIYNECNNEEAINLIHDKLNEVISKINKDNT